MQNRFFQNLRFLFSVLALSGIIQFIFPPNLISQNRAEENRVFSPELKTEKSIISFEENRGQFDARVRFLARTASGNVFLTATEAVYVIHNRKAENSISETDSSQSIESRQPESANRATAVFMKFVGANPEPAFAGENQKETRTNYFKGAEAGWKTSIPNFAVVRYENVYDGIGMIWRGRENGAVQYDFLVQPNADANQIALEFDGADSIEIDADGSLLIHTPVGTIKQGKPFSYQETGGIKLEIESRFVFEQSKTENRKSKIRFALGEYDRSKPLTIDPTVTLNNLAFSTFLGSFADDIANDIAVDAAGSVYITGRTLSPSFPTTAGVFDAAANGNEDVFVSKINATGTELVFSTFLGGGFYDEGKGIAVDASGNVYIAGAASSTFPTTTGAYDTIFNGGTDAFVAKLNQSGSSLIYSTYIGASNVDSANDLAIDTSGNAYIVVRTSDAALDYPTTTGAFDTTFNGFDDAAVTKLNDTGTSLIYSTFLGGGSLDVGHSIVVNAAGEAFVAGSTTDDAVVFPTTAGAYDQTHNGATDFFATKINVAGTNLIYSTFIGGAGIDNANALAIDNAGNAYLTGTASPTFPTTAGVVDPVAAGSNEIGLSKLSANGATLIYSTFFGGTQGETGSALAVDDFGNAYLVGNNFLGDYTTTAGAFDTTFNGGQDAVLTVFNPAATALIYSTYLGGGGNEFSSDIALDADGNVYITGQTAGNATNLPTSAEAFQTFHGGAVDAFVAKFGDYAIAGRVIDPSGNPVANVLVAMSGQISGSMMTGADGRFGFLNTAPNQSHVITASRSGYSINPPLFNIANLNGNRELVFVGAVGSPTGGAGGTLRFQNLSVNKSENGASATLTVTRSGTITTTAPVTVDFQTTNGTALAGQDYAATNGVLTFNAFETSKTITVPITNDATLEPRESFKLTLSNPTNNAEIEPNRETATIAILDEDLIAGDLLISEFRQRGRLGANDEYVKLFNPNDFDITINAADNSGGLTLARASGNQVTPVVAIPNLLTIAARGHYLLTNNNPSGGYSLIDYPTGVGTTTAVGDQTFSVDIPDNSNLVLLRTTNTSSFNAENTLDAVGFGDSAWMTEGSPLKRISAGNLENCFVRKLTGGNLQDTNNNSADFLLIDNHATTLAGNNQTNVLTVLGAPAPATSESLRLMSLSDVGLEIFGGEVWDSTPVPNGRFGTLTVYRRITNHTAQPIFSLRLRATDFPTLGSAASRRFAARPDFRLLNSADQGETIKGVTLAAERLHPNGGGINSTLMIDAINQNNPLLPNESVIVAIKFGVMRHGRHRFLAAVEALR